MFLYSKWLLLPLTTRHELARVFNIPKKGSTEVHSNTIKSDGYDVRDIEKSVTEASMRAYLCLDEDEVKTMEELFEATVFNAENPTKLTESNLEKVKVAVPNLVPSKPPHGLTVSGVPKKCPHFCKNKEEHAKAK